jgi:hypothetical protein
MQAIVPSASLPLIAVCIKETHFAAGQEGLLDYEVHAQQLTPDMADSSSTPYPRVRNN